MTEHEFDISQPAPPENHETKEPLEVYRTTKTASGLSDVYRIITRKDRRNVTIILVLLWGSCAWGILSAWLTDGAHDMTAICFVLYVTLLLCWSRHVAKKTWFRGLDRMVQSEYLLEVFEDGYRITTTHNGREGMRTFTVWEDIAASWETPTYLVLQDHRFVEYWKKSDIAPDSRLFTATVEKRKYLDKDPKGKTYQAPPAKPAEVRTANTSVETSYTPVRTGLQKAGSVLSVLAVMAFIALFVWFSSVSSMPLYINILVICVLLCFPLASLVVGILMKRRGLQGKTCVQVGIVFTILIAVFGFGVSFGFNALDSVKNQDPTFVPEIAEAVGIEIPQDDENSSVTVYQGTADAGRFTNTTRSAMLYYSDAVAEDFEKRITQDDRWLCPLPTPYRGLLPFSAVNTQSSYYVLFYCVDTQTYNAIPNAAGTYRYLCLIFDPAWGKLDIYEYDLTYVP